MLRYLVGGWDLREDIEIRYPVLGPTEQVGQLVEKSTLQLFPHGWLMAIG